MARHERQIKKQLKLYRIFDFSAMKFLHQDMWKYLRSKKIYGQIDLFLEKDNYIKSNIGNVNIANSCFLCEYARKVKAKKQNTTRSTCEFEEQYFNCRYCPTLIKKVPLDFNNGGCLGGIYDKFIELLNQPKTYKFSYLYKQFCNQIMNITLVDTNRNKDVIL